MKPSGLKAKRLKADLRIEIEEVEDNRVVFVKVEYTSSPEEETEE